MNNISDFKSCPNCGGTSGYYRRMYVSGWTEDKKEFDGTPQNWHFFDYLSYSRLGKWYYCEDCRKKICKVETDIKK